MWIWQSCSTSMGANHPNWREPLDFLLWLQCFGVYTCICCHPQAGEDPTANGLSDPLDSGGMTVRKRWMARLMNTVFRQLAATIPSTDWGQLNFPLYRVIFTVQQNGKGNTSHAWRLTIKGRIVRWPQGPPPSRAGLYVGPKDPHHQGPDYTLAPKTPTT